MELALKFYRLLSVTKRYWLIPLLVALATIGGLLLFARGETAPPFAYSLF